MNKDEKLHLKKLIQESECGDNTQNIRDIKHSVKIRDDIRRIDKMRSENPTMTQDEFSTMCINNCNFLYMNYPDIFHKTVANEIDLGIMTRVLTILKKIEDGEIDQHEGSVYVGKLLKELYVDSALKRSEKLDKQHEQDKIPVYEGQKMSWKEYKLKQL